jgi:FkbM family methyltransferase
MWPKQKVVDVGAYQIAGDPVYAPLLLDPESELIGFEPDPEALAALRLSAGPRRVFLPHAVGDGRVRTLHVCAARDMTSLLEPNPQVLGLFHGFPTWGEVVATRAVQTARLDDLAETAGLTFLQMDIQGAELIALGGAQDRLRKALVLHLEVEFLPLYIDQPLFSDVERFLRERGFVFHRFFAPTSRVVSPMVVGGDLLAGLSQLVWADAVFVRDYSKLERLGDGELAGMAAIVHDCYQSWDLTLRLLNELDRRIGGDSGPRYLSALTGAPRASSDLAAER